MAGKPPYLRKREQVSRPSRDLSSDIDELFPVILKVERPLVKENAKVNVFQVPFQSIGISICGGKIKSSGLQACIAAVVPGRRS